LRVVSLDVDDQKATLTLASMTDLLQRTLPIRSVSGYDNDEYGGDLDGSYLITTQDLTGYGLPAPFGWGVIEDFPLIYLGETAALSGIYLGLDTTFMAGGDIANTSFDRFRAINATTRVSTEIPVSSIVPTLAANIVTLTAVNSLNVFRQSQGWEPRMSATFRGVNSPYPGSMAYAILLMCGAVEVDTSAFDALDTARPYLVGAYFNEPQAAGDIIRQIEQSALAQVYLNADGEWTARAFDPQATPIGTITDADCRTWDAQPTDQGPLSEVRVQYDWQAADNSFTEVSQSSDAVTYGQETSDSHRLSTYLRTEDDAREVVQRYALFKQRARRLIATQQRSLALISAQPGDLVTVTRSRAPSPSGAYSSNTLLIRDVTITLGGEVTIDLVLDDLGLVLDKVGSYTDDTGADWSTATAAQLATYGFYADDNGYIDATDIATRHRKVYW
jgi:hypothetical protein